MYVLLLCVIIPFTFVLCYCTSCEAFHAHYLPFAGLSLSSVVLGTLIVALPAAQGGHSNIVSWVMHEGFVYNKVSVCSDT